MEGASEVISSPSNAVKRPRNVDKWKKNVCKKKRNLGEEYISYNNGRVIPRRVIGESCACKLNCFDNISEDSRESIFSEFWASGSHLVQTSFIQKHVEQAKPKRRRTRDISKHRKFSRSFYLRSSDGNNVRVCMKAFCSILGVTKHRVRYACENMVSEAGEYLFCFLF